jgi:two-component system, OmpR family, response regulator
MLARWRDDRAQLMNHFRMQPKASWNMPKEEEPRILVVEDDPAIAELIAAMLESAWLGCAIRSSGAQAVQAFAKTPIDVLITDLRMSAGDGISLIETIRRTSMVPVIIVTGFAREFADRVRFLDNVTLINKPFNRQSLIRLVEKALDAGPHLRHGAVHAAS